MQKNELYTVIALALGAIALIGTAHYDWGLYSIYTDWLSSQLPTIFAPDYSLVSQTPRNIHPQTLSWTCDATRCLVYYSSYSDGCAALPQDLTMAGAGVQVCPSFNNVRVDGTALIGCHKLSSGQSLTFMTNNFDQCVGLKVWSFETPSTTSSVTTSQTTSQSSTTTTIPGGQTWCSIAPTTEGCSLVALGALAMVAIIAGSFMFLKKKR